MMGEEIIIGKNPVMEALQSGRSVNKVIISNQLNKKTEREIRNAVKNANTILQKAPIQRIDQLSKGRHQGIIAYVSAYEYSTVQAILNRATEKEELPFIIILDRKSTRLNSSHVAISYAVFCLKKKRKTEH